MTSFGERIKALAIQLGKEDQEVAEDIGLSKSQMSHYTTGARKVPSEILDKIVQVYGINPSFLFRDSPLYGEGSQEEVSQPVVSEGVYDYYPVSVAAGILCSIEGVTENNVEKMAIPDMLMGKHAGSNDVYITKVNGDSMNKLFPHESLIAVKRVSILDLKDDDIVVFSDENEYSVKRYFNNTESKEFVFGAESTDRRFRDHFVSYEDAGNLNIHGKVVMYIVSTD